MKQSGILSGFWAYLKYIWNSKKRMFFYGLLFFPTYVAANYIQIYLTKLVVQELEEQCSISYLTISVGVLVLFLLLCNWFSVRMHTMMEYANRVLVQNMQNAFTEKLLSVDYKYLEDKGFVSLRNMVRESLFGGNIGDAQEREQLKEFMTELIHLLASIGTVVLYSFYLLRLSPWLLLILVLIPLLTVFSTYAVRRSQAKTAEQGAEAWQRLDYITRRSEDFDMAKDVRLYGMDRWFHALSLEYWRELLHYKGKEMKLRGMGDLLGIFIDIYYVGLLVCIVYQLQQGRLQASDVVFYAGLGPSLFSLLDFDVCTGFVRLSRISIEFHRYQEFYNYGKDAGIVGMKVQRKAPEIRLEHMSFHYPGDNRMILEDINLNICPGEKLAIVGVNGAGKTTLMKLICGLLHPTEGKILLNGKDLEEMTAQERYAWFSCVFQDIQFLPLSIRENITMNAGGKENDKRVWECLCQADMQEAVKELPDGLDTLLVKSLNEKAVDFSGGQRQKLILSRALYRDAGTLILDEPTAALDALAEKEIYEKYASFSKGKTSLFVSHRLAGTRFCDRILLLNGGHVAEEGTHEQLLLAGGLYAEMFALQSKYYQ